MGSIVRSDQQAAFDNKWVADYQKGIVSEGHYLWVRQRRIKMAVDETLQLLGSQPSELSALTTCGGTGGEASYLADRGFTDVTNSDFSTGALEVAQKRDERLAVRWIDMENSDVPDESYDIVLVQDGLHHLTRPVQGFNEMIRMARQAVIVIEPHQSLIGRLIGTEWEKVGDAVNYVFRWDHDLFAQTARSQLVREPTTIWTKRFWDHNQAVSKLSNWTSNEQVKMGLTRTAYGALSPLDRLGNMFVGILIK
ncbi:MAG: class I SAM-dependent methyltransferase [Acidimicrobiales bacterium]